MSKEQKIFKLIDWIKENPNIDFIELIDYANCNNLIDTLNKYNKLFIYAHFDSLTEKDTSWLVKKWDEWEDNVLDNI